MQLLQNHIDFWIKYSTMSKFFLKKVVLFYNINLIIDHPKRRKGN